MEKTKKTTRKTTFNFNYFDKIETQDRAYFLGLLFADGCNHFLEGKVTIGLNEIDKGILESFKVFLETERPFIYKAARPCKSTKTGKVYESKPQYILALCSRHFCHALNELGMIPKKSLLLKFPAIDKNLYPDFIRGYFDGDGCISHNKAITSIDLSLVGTLEFLSHIKDYLLHNSPIKSIKIKPIGNAFILEISNILDALYFYDLIYKDSYSEIRLQRKFDKFHSLYLHGTNNLNLSKKANDRNTRDNLLKIKDEIEGEYKSTSIWMLAKRHKTSERCIKRLLLMNNVKLRTYEESKSMIKV